MNNEACANCKWYRVRLYEGNAMGICHYSPPVLLSDPEGKPIMGRPFVEPNDVCSLHEFRHLKSSMKGLE